MKRSAFFVLFACFFNVFSALAAPPVYFSGSKYKDSNKLRFSLSGAVGVLNDNLIEGQIYKPIALYPQVYYSLSKSQNRSFLDLYLETQFVFVYIDSKEGSESIDAEFGVNLGLQYNLYISQQVDLFFSLGSGPHFVTVDSPQQADGFIFSDNLSLGAKKKFAKGWSGAVFIRLRHLSNLNLNKPNKGINTAFVGVGINKPIF